MRFDRPTRPRSWCRSLSPEVLRVVDDDRIGIGHVDARLDDRRSHQHVELAVDKVHHQLFELLGRHLPVSHRHARLRAKLPDHAADVVDRLDLVVHEIDLPAALEFVIDRLANQLLVEQMALG